MNSGGAKPRISWERTPDGLVITMPVRKTGHRLYGAISSLVVSVLLWFFFLNEDNAGQDSMLSWLVADIIPFWQLVLLLALGSALITNIVLFGASERLTANR
ncbi:hypothetical protein ACKTEK_08095 [Tepidamorphus sp. 3E244]|uniref:hypothetical protein n=1 Tax=Tepidamorphus sp. 3E244 TaxID=3385498 RepID=UPI0038FC4E4E